VYVSGQSLPDIPANIKSTSYGMYLSTDNDIIGCRFVAQIIYVTMGTD